MDKDTRNAIERATQRARTLLEDDFASQLEGTFDVLRDGRVAPKAGSHLSLPQIFQRDKIVGAIEHKRAAGMNAAEAVVDYLRDAAFTTLNRFVALKMLEARELVQECITKGEQSSGYREFYGMAAGVALLPESAGYRLYIESLFDELSTEVKVLFDRRDPASVLWPRRATFEALLDELNAADLSGVWGEDETIGWVYQYFNSHGEREASKRSKRVPEKGGEISLRSQYFTPKHVVGFLVDNTLGALWAESHTSSEIESLRFLIPPATGRPLVERRDPRDIRILDPACGSGHFLLYAFELFTSFYREAWGDSSSPPSPLTSHTLREDYPTELKLDRALPGLILRHNLFGVDVDARCAQIASLALWMRAQRTYRDLDIARADRAKITRSNIVVAAPIPAERSVVNGFTKTLSPQVARIFRAVVDQMKYAGDLGTLLRIETKVADCIQEIVAEHGPLFKLADREAWTRAEESLATALREYASSDVRDEGVRRGLFSDDVVHGLDFIDICRERYDAVVLNPPYTEVGGPICALLRSEYPENWTNLYSAFVERALELSSARVGVVCSDSLLTGYRMRNLRKEFLLGRKLVAMAPLDRETFDGMGLPTVALVLQRHRSQAEPVLGELDSLRFTVTDIITAEAVSEKVDFVLTPDLIRHGHKSWEGASQLGDKYAVVTSGNRTFDDFRYVRMWWEIDSSTIGDYWHPWQKGGEYQPFFSSTHFVMRWDKRTDGLEIRVFGVQRVGTDAQVAQSSRHWWHRGIVGPTMNTTGAGFNARVLPAGQIISAKSTGIFPKQGIDPFFVLGLLNSRAIRWMLFQQGAGLSGNTGKIQNLPISEPFPEQREMISDLAQRAAVLIAQLESFRETSPYFLNPIGDPLKIAAEYRSIIEQLDDQVADMCACGEIDSRVPAGTELVEKAVAEATGGLDSGGGWLIVSYLFGMAVGRWQHVDHARVPPSVESLFEPMPHLLSTPGESSQVDHAILVDDDGHSHDVCAALVRAGSLVPSLDFEALLESVSDGHKRGIREWLGGRFFELHRAQYSEGRRKAPIYWQLATPFASYSVWLYLQALTSDTLYMVQNDFVAPKLAHEDRRLESLRREIGSNPRASDRKALAAQEVFVEELREFLAEIKRVAPLWNPNLDDGVVVNFSLLWRLVPHHKTWQKELKAAWDALCAGDYDWAHLAMHLWPERVVPKCTTDRSLAIAHDLEDVFWVEGTDGKWKSRATPLKSVEELIHERSSPAVKAAVSSLLDAPSASGRGRTRGRSVAPTPATESSD